MVAVQGQLDLGRENINAVTSPVGTCRASRLRVNLVFYHHLSAIASLSADIKESHVCLFVYVVPCAWQG